ncbi:MAG: protein kinase [Kiritimatiellae bacterium]|nr:protein kinase [Kiritimatiellia bacterium]
MADKPNTTQRIHVSPETAVRRLEDRDAGDRQTVRVAPGESAPSAESPPAMTSGYAVMEKIGDGGMGVVYLAKDRKLDRYVAIKRLNASALEDEALRRRFFREAEAIAALSHSNIVHVYALAEDKDGPYIAMEYVAGPADASPGKSPSRPFTLADRVHRDGPLPVGEAVSLLVKLCKAMQYAHKRGVIHRDLKPSNILLDAQSEPKIVDFGLAHRASATDQDLTVPGERMLSLGYGAPEQERDATQTDARSDVYGLGALLYFSLTSKNPRFFREKDIPEALRTAIEKALETDPQNRWPTVAEFADALLLVQAPSSIELPSAKTTWRCKWCDTINPVAVQYCGKCGWNGGEYCWECGTETRVGVQFCGACGADAREYERISQLLELLLRHREQKKFEYVVQHAGQVSGFVPVGARGQRTVDRIQRLSEESRRSIERRDFLRGAIDREFKQENYERVQSYIEEFRTLSDDLLFEDMYRGLPALVAERDLQRAREAVSRGNLDEAMQLTQHVLSDVRPGNRDALRISRQIKKRRLRLTLRNTGIILVSVFCLYLLSAAPAYRFLGGRASRVYVNLYRFVDYVHDATVLRGVLSRYAGMWGVDEMFTKEEPGSARR